MDRILIIQTAFLGDVILATPVVAELKRLFPEATIDFLLKKGNESLLENNPSVNEVITFDKGNGKTRAIYQLIKRFRKTKYDLVINLHRFGSSGMITGFSGAKLKYGFDKNPYAFLFSKKFTHSIGDGTHEVTRNLSLIKEFGAKELVRPELFPSNDASKKVAKYISQDYVCLAPASVWFTKQLPKKKWIELVEKIDKKVYLLGGPADEAFCESIKLSCEDKEVVNLCGELSLLESAALMKGAKMNYVNDSGPLHLASATNAPVTAFFCSTIPDFGFGPLSEDSAILEVKNLSCRPCGLHGHKECPKSHFDCGNKMDLSSIS